MFLRHKHEFIDRFVCLMADEPAPPAGGGTSPVSDTVSPPSPPSGGDSPAPSETITPDTDIFGSAFDDFEESGEQVEPAKPAIPVQAAPTGVPAKPAPAPAPGTPPQPVAPEPAPPAPKAPEPPPASAAPDGGLDPGNPSAIAQAMEANHDAIVAHLARTSFALSPEDAAALEENAAAHLPNLLARTFLESQKQMMRTLDKLIPTTVAAQMRVANKAREGEDAFYSKFHGAIDRSKHGATVRRFAVAYRNANPQMPREQFFEEVGAMVMAALKLTPAAAPSGVQVPAVNGRAKVVQPFVPAAGGPTNMGGGGQPAGPSDPWAGMDREYEEG